MKIVDDVYNNGNKLLFIGDLPTIFLAFITAGIGVTILGSSVSGWLLRKTYLFERIILFLSALILIKPGIISDILGLVGLGIVLLTQKK